MLVSETTPWAIAFPLEEDEELWMSIVGEGLTEAEAAGEGEVPLVGEGLTEAEAAGEGEAPLVGDEAAVTFGVGVSQLCGWPRVAAAVVLEAAADGVEATVGPELA